jgi:hypothetical protein
MDENEKSKKIFYLFSMNHYPLKILILVLFTGIAGTGCVNTRIKVEGLRLDRYIQQIRNHREIFQRIRPYRSGIGQNTY